MPGGWPLDGCGALLEISFNWYNPESRRGCISLLNRARNSSADDFILLSGVAMDRLLRMFIQDYLAGNRTLADVQGRIIDITWDMVDEVGQDALDLARQADLHIAEFTGGHISEDVLKSTLRELAGLTSVVITSNGSQPAAKWRSQAQTHQLTWVCG